MDLAIAEKYNSASQKVRVITESWVGQNLFCPYCGVRVKDENNGFIEDSIDNKVLENEGCPVEKLEDTHI